VLVVTSDLPEALRIADRLQVVRGGTTTVEFGPDATQVDVLAAAVSLKATLTPVAEKVAAFEHTGQRGAPEARPD